MSDTEKVGMLPGFGWIAGHSFLATLILVWMITPGMVFVLGVIGESRLVPWTPSKQYLSFFPGDLFLGVMTAVLLVTLRRLPSGDVFYNSTWFHGVILLVTMMAAIAVTYGEYNDPEGYGKRAVISPTKLYHNIVLYGGYGYVVIVMLVAVVASLIMSWDASTAFALGAALLPGLIWVALLVIESGASDEVKQSRHEHAHIEDWNPIWTH